MISILFRCHQTEKMLIGKFFKKNARFQHFFLKMWALEKWCVTKVPHCIPMLWRPSSSSSTISNIFFSETAGPIKAKFYVEPPCVGGMKVCSRHLGHMTKIRWPPCPYMVKTLQKSSSLEADRRFPRNLVCSIRDSSPS